jgi:hypothetical protein
MFADKVTAAYEQLIWKPPIHWDIHILPVVKRAQQNSYRNYFRGEHGHKWLSNLSLRFSGR